MINSTDNSKIKYLAKLNNKKFRIEEKKFLVEGAHLVKEAKIAGVLEEAFSIEEKEEYTQISEACMKKISNTDTVVKEIGLCKMNLKKEMSDHILILDRVQDPGNMGAIMRSANAFGFTTIILGNGCCDIFNDKVIRSSQGAIFKLNFIEANLLDFIPTLKEYKVYGTNVVNGIDLKNVKKEKKLAIILGNEGQGISEDIFKLVDKNIYISMNNTESLNVSVAASIIMYELR